MSGHVRVVQALYRNIRKHAIEYQKHQKQNQTFVRAVRSGDISLEEEENIKTKWKTEKHFNNLLSIAQEFPPEDVESETQLLSRTVREAFEQKLSDEQIHECLDIGFETLRTISSHNACIRQLMSKHTFENQPEPQTIQRQYNVGDQVYVQDDQRGVVVGWTTQTMTVNDKPLERIVYYVILEDEYRHYSEWRQYKVHEPELSLIKDSDITVSHPSLSLYFKGFERGKYIPSEPLRLKYPANSLSSASPEQVIEPSVLDIQSAEEQDLVAYLKSPNPTIVQLAKTTLEGYWMHEKTLEDAGELMQILQNFHETKDHGTARTHLKALLKKRKDWALVYEKFGYLELDAGNFDAAIKHYRSALHLKPHEINALGGIATCALKIFNFQLAFSHASKLINLYPSSPLATRIFEEIERQEGIVSLS